MSPPSTDPQSDALPARLSERRADEERRAGERRRLTLVPPQERRSQPSRRQASDRRVSPELRGRETAEEHVRNALQLLTSIAVTGSLDDELRRDLDAAIFRLHFAVERLQRGER